MLIGLKGDNYYSRVFKRVNYKLSNSTFWVVITTQGCGWHEWLRVVSLRFKCYEQLNIVDDMNDSESWTQSSRYYEYLRALVDMNESESWA